MAQADALITQCLRRLNELLPNSPVHWTRDEILVFVNDALCELNLLSGDNQTTIAVPINNTENVYAIDSSVIGPMSARVGNRYLLRESVMDLDNEVNWEALGATRMNVNTWAPIGLNLILIYPRPIVATDLSLECLAQYVAVTDAAVDLPIRQNYDLAIEDFVVSRAMFKEGGAEAQQAVMFYNKFLDAVKELTGRNIVRGYPAWDIIEAKTSETTLREGANTRSGEAR